MYRIYNRCIEFVPELSLTQLKRTASIADIVQAMISLIKSVKSKKILKNTQKTDWEVFVDFLSTWKSLTEQELRNSFGEIKALFKREFLSVAKEEGVEQPKIDKRQIFKSITSPQLLAGIGNDDNNVQLNSSVNNLNNLDDLHEIYQKISEKYSQLLQQNNNNNASASSASRQHQSNKKDKKEDTQSALLRYVRNIVLAELKSFLEPDAFAELSKIKQQLQNDDPNKIPLLKEFAKKLCDLFQLSYADSQLEIQFIQPTRSLAVNLRRDMRDDPLALYKNLNRDYVKIEQFISTIAQSSSSDTLQGKTAHSAEGILQNILGYAKKINFSQFDGFILDYQMEDLQLQQAIIQSLGATTGRTELFTALAALRDIFLPIIKILGAQTALDYTL